MIQGTPNAAVIITAAGSSRRMGAENKKEFLKLNNESVLKMSIKPFLNLKIFSKFVIVLPKNEIDNGKNLLSELPGFYGFIFIQGGSTRQKSVYNGLMTLKEDSPDIVLIHDGARPWITEKVIREVYEKTIQKNAAVPVVPSVNAMKSLNSRGFIESHLKRELTVAAQTPQGFNYSKILQGHKAASKNSVNYIDDAEIYGEHIGSVATVPGDTANKKITYISDMPGRQQVGCSAMQP
jgi:2-C-methyl-D-erythritol 4-phosphate cytidylyltransferase